MLAMIFPKRPSKAIATVNVTTSFIPAVYCTSTTLLKRFHSSLVQRRLRILNFHYL
jgi:hypothetical protein